MKIQRIELPRAAIEDYGIEGEWLVIVVKPDEDLAELIGRILRKEYTRQLEPGKDIK